MPDLTGLPDFQAPLASIHAAAFAPYGSGAYLVLPQLLTLATDSVTNVKFALVFERRAGDFSSSGEYAVLDFSIAGDFALDDALAAARTRDPSTTVKPVAVNCGFARLYTTAGEVELSSDLLQPVALGLSGPDFARFTARVSATAGELVKGAIAGGSLLLGARVEYDAFGVAPRIAAVVEFVPQQLVAALAAGKSAVATSDVVAAFASGTTNLPLKIVGGALPPGDFAGAMTARIFAAYGSLAAAPGAADPPYVTFADAAQLATAPLQWDLSQAALGVRQWVLTLDLLTSLRALASAGAIDALVRYISIPALQDGECSVTLNADLPLARTGVAVIGATVEVAANPPARPSSIVSTVNFVEPDDDGSVNFRLSPSEPLAYTTSGFAVVTAGSLVRQYAMPAQRRSDPWVQLYADDFPVAFAHVTAADRLLALATVNVTVNYVLDGHPVAVESALTRQIAGSAIAVPRSATNAVMTVTATPLDGSAALALAPTAPGRLDLDLTAFREFGPQRIAITATLGPASPPFSIDLLAQEQGTVAGAVPDQRFLAAGQPTTTWGYVAASPFCAGYRYRISASTNAPAGAWSEVLSPFAPLVLDVAGAQSKNSSTDHPAQPAAAAAAL